MKIVEQTTNWRVFQMAAKHVAAAGGNIQPIKNREFMTDTGAKVYYLGGGWWKLYGYHYAEQDTRRSMDAICKSEAEEFRLKREKQLNAAYAQVDKLEFNR